MKNYANFRQFSRAIAAYSNSHSNSHHCQILVDHELLTFFIFSRAFCNFETLLLGILGILIFANLRQNCQKAEEKNVSTKFWKC